MAWELLYQWVGMKKYNIFTLLVLVMVGVGITTFGHTKGVQQVEKPTKYAPSFLTNMISHLMPVKPYASTFTKNTFDATNQSISQKYGELAKMREQSSSAIRNMEKHIFNIFKDTAKTELRDVFSAMIFGTPTVKSLATPNKVALGVLKPKGLFFNPIFKINAFKQSFEVGGEKDLGEDVSAKATFNSKHLLLKGVISKKISQDLFLNFQTYQELSHEKSNSVQFGLNFNF